MGILQSLSLVYQNKECGMFNLYTLEKSIVKHMDAARVPGLALAIIQDGEISYVRGFGVTSVEDGGVAVTPETLFRIGSTTKALTGTAIMRLVEAGKLDLEQPVSSYLDWLTFDEPGAQEQVTLRMLLSHTSGLPTDTALSERRDPDALETFLRHELPHYPLNSPPGKLFSYSNLNLMLAGGIAQHVSGKPYPQMMQELLFTPLQMKRTTFDPLVAMTYPLAHGHTLRKDGTLAVEHRFLENTAGYPAGFAISTVLDMANFALLHLNQGYTYDKKLLAPETIARMQEPQAPLFTRKERYYGLTFCLERYQGRRMVGHDGVIGSSGCQFALLPDDGIGAVLLYNRLDLDGPGILSSLFDRLLGSSRKTSGLAGEISRRLRNGRTSWSMYTGTYLSLYIGLVKITVVEQQLTLELYDEQIPLKLRRKHLYAGTWEAGELEITVGFVPEEHGKGEYIVVNPYGDDAASHLLECKRVELNDAIVNDYHEWKDYLGKYSHPALGSYTISLVDNRGTIRFHEEDEQVLCTPLDNHQFACRWGVFEFRKGEDGEDVYLLHQGYRIALPRVMIAQHLAMREELLSDHRRSSNIQ
jgi:CubicO group peptidase (beta-lactamase class C family)